VGWHKAATSNAFLVTADPLPQFVGIVRLMTIRSPDYHSFRSTSTGATAVPDKQHTTSVSESESPAIPAPAPKTDRRPRTNKDWWPNQLDLCES
jgi:hypothetical protein